jgi:uncharacterized membrane protein YeaQ/YmgE (transglycosylase-associated protein family)
MVTVGRGFTVIVKVLVSPRQSRLFSVLWGVTLIVATIGAVVVLVAVNEILPVPLLAPSPMAVFEFVQV